MEKLVNLFRINPEDGLFLGDKAFINHFHSCSYRCSCRTFSGPRLKHPEISLLDGKLDILHISVMFFQRLVHINELVILIVHDLFQRDLGSILLALYIDGHGCPDACNHILSLCILEVLAVEHILSGCRVSGKGNAGSRTVSHVPEYHCLDIHCGSPFAGDVIEFSVGDGPGGIPGPEHCLDTAPDLLHGIGRKRLSGQGLDLVLHDADQFLQIGSIELCIELDTFFMFHVLKFFLEGLGIGIHDHVGIHLDKTAVAVICKAFIAAEFDETLDGLVIDAEVQNRIHHTRHGCPGTGTYGEQQWCFRIAETEPHGLFHLADCFFYLDPEVLRQSVRLIVYSAHVS